MKSRQSYRQLVQIADLQRLTRELRQHDMARRVDDTERAQTQERMASARCDRAIDEFNALLAGPQMCVDRLALAAQLIGQCVAENEHAGGQLVTARELEESARLRLVEADHRHLQFSKLARTAQRKSAEKLADTAIADCVTIMICKEER